MCSVDIYTFLKYRSQIYFIERVLKVNNFYLLIILCTKRCVILVFKAGGLISSKNIDLESLTINIPFQKVIYIKIFKYGSASKPDLCKYIIILKIMDILSEI